MHTVLKGKKKSVNLEYFTILESKEVLENYYNMLKPYLNKPVLKRTESHCWDHLHFQSKCIRYSETHEFTIKKKVTREPKTGMWLSDKQLV